MRVELKVEQGSYSFTDPSGSGATIEGAGAWVSYQTDGGKALRTKLFGDGCITSEAPVNDVHGSGSQLMVETPIVKNGVGLTFRLKTYDQQPFILVQLSVINRTPGPLYLEQFCVCQVGRPDGGKLQFNNSRGGERFFKVGWHGWAYTGLMKAKDVNSRRLSDLVAGSSYSNPLTLRPHSPGEFWSEGWGILAGVETALVAGFVSTARQFGQVYACFREGAIEFRLVTQLDGIRLDPGETCDSEWGYLQFVNLPHPEPAVDYVETVAREMKARLPASPPPPMWTHWYHFYHDITAQLFLQNLDSLAIHRQAVPLQITELDDGYQSAWGDWTTTNTNFPGGLSHLSEKIREKGFTPGLWLAPFTVESKAIITKAHPGWLVKDKRGKPINAGFLYNRFIHSLDTSHPAVLEHVRSLLDLVSHQWGFKMVKVDFINTAALPGRRYNPKLTRAECLRLGLKAIRQGIGEETFFLASGCPFGPAIGIVDAMRIGPDTASSWEPYFHWLPWAGPLIRKETSMPSLRNAIRHTLNLSLFHQRWWWNDPDCLLVRDMDTRLTGAEVQSSVTLVGLSGGMLVSSDDLSKVNPDRLRWISLLIPYLGSYGLAVDILEKEMPEIYQVKLRAIEQDWQLVGLFNWSEHTQACRIGFERLGFERGSVLEVFDFWHESYLYVTGTETTFKDVPPHGCKLLRISKFATNPHIVGDTLHISQGMEFTSFQVDDGILSIDTIDLGRSVSGKLWLRLPKKPVSTTCNDKRVEVEVMHEGIYALRLDFINKARIEVIL